MNKIRKIFKVFTLFLICLLMLAIIAIAFVAATIDANDFKPQIQSLLNKELGRQLTINSDIELSVFPWLEFSSNHLSLSNAPGGSDKPFAEIEKGNIKIKFLPLLANKIEIQQVRIKGLTLHLTKNKQGITNWDDLIENRNDNSEPSFLLDSLTIGNISIEHANIIWDDQQQGIYTEISDFNFKASEFIFDHPVQVVSSLTLVNREPAIKQVVKLASFLTINKAFDTFKFEAINIDSVTYSKKIPLSPLKLSLLADVALNLNQQTLDIATLEINTTDLLISAEINVIDLYTEPLAKGAIKIPSFNLSQFLNHMAISIPTPQNPKALSDLSVAFDIRADAESAIFNNITLTVDDSTITGLACIKDYTRPSSHFRLKVDTLNMDNYLPEGQQAAPNALKKPDDVLSSSTSIFPIATLQQLNIGGLLTIDKLTIKDLSMLNINIQLQTKSQQIDRAAYDKDYCKNLLK